MRKENDIMLNILANPNMSISDLKAVGLNANNTSLETEEMYKKHPKILEAFQNSDGSFDNEKFHLMYLTVGTMYNNLANDTYSENIYKQTSYHRDNIFAPIDLRRKGPDSLLIRVSNPFRHTSSMVRLGELEESPLSIEEIAESLKVLTNPVEVSKGAKPIYSDSPEESFFHDFLKTRVLALWDEDGTHIDPITGQEIQHKKGDKKLNDNGTFYYENLDGRDIYGRQVLNKMNVLTAESSPWNKYDFFDSDDKEEKSIGGSIMKNLALVGSMYIPYVGPAIAIASIATQGAGMLAVLGKMLTGSKSPTLSAIEGLSKSINRLTAKSEYAQQNMWCWENFIDMIGDSLAQFKEQRVLFSNIPAIIKGKYGMSEEGLKEFELNQLKKYNELDKTLFKDILKNPSFLTELFKLMEKRNGVNALRAAADAKAYTKEYLKIGEILSKSYMTGITVADTYGEAKNQGASDLEASLLTLGYGAAEAALLNTGVGEWLFPELRYNKMHTEAIAKALVPTKQISSELAKKSTENLTKTETKVLKLNFVKKIFNIGAQACKDLYSGAKSTGEKTVSNAIANAMGEGTEEVTEEILLDASNGFFNLLSWLRNDDTILDTNVWNKQEGWTPKKMFDDYFMNFLGGAIGGGIAGFNLENIKAIKGLNDMTSKEAMSNIIQMVLDGSIDKFLKQSDKILIADKNLSSKIISEDGKQIYAQGTETDNQDIDAHKILHQQVQIIKDIMSSNGIDMSTQSFLRGLLNLIKDAKFSFLQNSKSAGLYAEEYTELSKKIVKLATEIQAIELINSTTSDSKEKLKEIEKKSDDTKILKLKLKELKQVLNDLKDLLEGKHLINFVSTALLEMSPAISNAFIRPTKEKYLEHYYKKPYKYITEEEKLAVKEQFENWEKLEKPSDLRIAADMYMEAAHIASDTIKSQSDIYIQSSLNSLLQGISNYFKFGIYRQTEKLSSLVPEETDENWRDVAGHLIKALIPNYARELVSLLSDTTIEKIKLLDEQNSQLERDTDHDLSAAILANRKRINELIVDELYPNVNNIVNSYIKQGFILTEEKNNLINVLETLIKEINIRKSELLISDEERITKSKSEETKAKLKLEEAYIKLTSEIATAIAKILNLNHSPIEENIKLFAKTVFGEDIDISKLLTDVSLLLETRKDSIDEFILELNIDDKLRHTLELIQLYKTILLGSSVDIGNYENIFGLNKTLNEVAKNIHPENWQDLAEIDLNIVNVFSLDLDKLDSKISFLRKLNAINQGQKINTQKRVGLNTTYLFYKKFNDIVKYHFPGWKDIDKLQQVIDNALTILKYINDKNRLSVSKEDLEKIEKERIQMEDAIYDFFLANQDKLDNLSEVLSHFLEDLFEESNVILDLNTPIIDTNSFIWWMATRVAVKASDFYKMFSEITSDDIAPIPTLVLAVYTNYASIVNGNIFDKFVYGYKNAVKQLWNQENPEEFRKKVLAKVGIKKVPKEFENDPLKFLLLPRWTNITLTEGIPGSGKTLAVFKETIRLLQKYHLSDGLLDNVFYIHGANKKSAEEAIDKKHLNLLNAKAYGLKDFMEFISGEGNAYNEDFESNVEGELVSSRKLIAQTENIPSIIFIDEISNFSAFLLDTINKYAREHNITVIAAGDFDQNGYSSKVNLQNDGELLIELNRLNFIRSPKQGVSMRTANSLKNTNLVKILALLQNLDSLQLELKYYESDTELCGDKIINVECFNTDKYYDPEYDLLEDGELYLQILKLVNIATEPIGLIYHHDDSKLVKFCEEHFPGKFIKYKGNEAQGKEGEYFIIEPEYATTSNDSNIISEHFSSYIKDLYTSISRAKKGSIIINYTLQGQDVIRNKNGKNFKLTNSKPDTLTILESPSKQQIKKYSEEYKNLLKTLITLEPTVIYNKRNNSNPIISTSSKTNNSNLEEATKLSEVLVNNGITFSIEDTIYIDGNLVTVKDLKLANDNASIIITYEDINNNIASIVYDKNKVSTIKPNILSELEKNQIKLQALLNLNISENTPIILNGTRCKFNTVKVYNDKSVNVITAYDDGTLLEWDIDWFKDNYKVNDQEWIPNVETEKLLNINSITFPYNGRDITLNVDFVDFIDIEGNSGNTNIIRVNYGTEVLPTCVLLINDYMIPFIYKDNKWISFYKTDLDIIKNIENTLNNSLGTNLQDIGPEVLLDTLDDWNLTKLEDPERNIDYNDIILKIFNLNLSNEESNTEEESNLEFESEKLAQQLLSEANLENLGVISSDLADDQENEEVKLNLVYYSFNTFTTGIIYDDVNDIAKQSGSDERNLLRNDCINGLIHIDQKYGHPIRTVLLYIDILKKIRSVLLHETDIIEINKKVSNILKNNEFGKKNDNGFEQLNILSIFALKISAAANEYSEYGSNEDSGNYRRYDHSKKEHTEFVRATDARSDEVLRKNITWIMGDSEGNLLEIPLLTLADPVGILNRLSDDTLMNLWDKCLINHPDNIYDLLKEFLNEFPDNLKTKYKSLLDLIEIYFITDNSIWPLYELGSRTPFVPSKILHNYGPNIVYYDTGQNFYEVNGFAYSPDYISIKNLENNGIMKVSPIYFSNDSEGRLIGSDGNPLKITIKDKDGNFITTDHIIKSGMPFVFVTDDLYLQEKDFLQEYINQIEHPDIPKRVFLAYVLPPKIPMEEYLDNIIKLYRKEPISVKAGNWHTDFALIAELFNNEDFLHRLLSMKGINLPYYTQLIKLANLQDKDNLKRWMLTPLSSYNNKKPITLFRNFLRDLLLYKDKSQFTNSTLDVNEEIKNLILTTLSKKSIYVLASRKQGVASIGLNLYEVNGDPLEYKILGGIDTSIFKGDSRYITDAILNHMGIKSNALGPGLDGHFYKDSGFFSEHYLNGTLFTKGNVVNPGSIKPNRFELNYRNLISSLPDELKSLFKDTTIHNEEEYKSIINLIKQTLLDNGYPVININNILFEYKSKVGDSCSIITIDGTDQEATIDLNNELIGVMTVYNNGKETKYTVVYNKDSDLKLSLYKENISEENLENNNLNIGDIIEIYTSEGNKQDDSVYKIDDIHDTKYGKIVNLTNISKGTKVSLSYDDMIKQLGGKYKKIQLENNVISFTEDNWLLYKDLIKRCIDINSILRNLNKLANSNTFEEFIEEINIKAKHIDLVKRSLDIIKKTHPELTETIDSFVNLLLIYKQDLDKMNEQDLDKDFCNITPNMKL